MRCSFCVLQGVAVELMRGSASSRSHMDVSRVGHHRPPIRSLPDSLRRVRFSGGFHYCHGALHPAARGERADGRSTRVTRVRLSTRELTGVCF